MNIHRLLLPPQDSCDPSDEELLQQHFPVLPDLREKTIHELRDRIAHLSKELFVPCVQVMGEIEVRRAAFLNAWEHIYAGDGDEDDESLFMEMVQDGAIELFGRNEGEMVMMTGEFLVKKLDELKIEDEGI